MELNSKDAKVEAVEGTDVEADSELLRLEAVESDDSVVALVDDVTASVNGACEASAAPMEGTASLPVGIAELVTTVDEGSGNCV